MDVEQVEGEGEGAGQGTGEEVRQVVPPLVVPRVSFDPLARSGWGEASDTVPYERVAGASGVPMQNVALCELPHDALAVGEYCAR